MRDSQRAKVYRADHSLDTYGRLETVEEIEVFVKKLWKLERFKKEFPKAATWWTNPPEVKDGRGRRRANGSSYAIKMPKWSRTKGVVCHELAHTVHIRENSGMGSRPFAWHDWQFCAIYLKIVLYSMGREAHAALKAAFKKNRVRFTAPRQRYYSPEERAAIAARFSVYRQQKEEQDIAV